MSTENYAVHAALYTNYANSDSQALRRFSNQLGKMPLMLAVTRAIDDADRGSFLRSDTRYFLLVNFHYLIIEPILQSAKTNFRISTSSNSQIEADVLSDITVIINTAAKAGAFNGKTATAAKQHIYAQVKMMALRAVLALPINKREIAEGNAEKKKGKSCMEERPTAPFPIGQPNGSWSSCS